MNGAERETHVNRFEDVKAGFPDLGLLEEKVQRVLDRLELLREENRELHDRLIRTESDRDKLKTQVGGLEQQLAHARANGRDRSKEESIRRKVEGLLQRLEEL